MKIDRSFFIDKKMWKTSEALTLRRRKLSVISLQASFYLLKEKSLLQREEQ